MNPRELAQQALIVKCVNDLTNDALKTRRTDLADTLANGDRVNVTSPDDPNVDIGMVYRTKPKGTPAVTDQAQFTKWMLDNYPDRVQQIPTIKPGDIGEAVVVLRRHAPHLVTTTPTVMDWAVNEVLKLTEQARQACGPGGELDVPGVAYEPPKPGAVTVKLSDDGPAVIERLWRTGRINFTTGEVRALPAGGDE